MLPVSWSIWIQGHYHRPAANDKTEKLLGQGWDVLHTSPRMVSK